MTVCVHARYTWARKSRTVSSSDGLNSFLSCVHVFEEQEETLPRDSNMRYYQPVAVLIDDAEVKVWALFHQDVDNVQRGVEDKSRQVGVVVELNLSGRCTFLARVGALMAECSKTSSSPMLFPPEKMAKCQLLTVSLAVDILKFPINARGTLLRIHTRQAETLDARASSEIKVQKSKSL